VQILAVVGGLLVAVLAWAVGQDLRESRRGTRRRPSADIAAEAANSRLDLDAVPHEPARRAGQRDWATYRARDRRPPAE